MAKLKSYTRHNVSFTAGDAECAAWLYLPAGVPSPPVVLLGHGLTVASRHPELLAAVSQCPFTDGLASARALGPRASLKLLPFVARDLAAKARGADPVTLPLAGPPGSVALMNAPDALPGYQA